MLTKLRISKNDSTSRVEVYVSCALEPPCYAQFRGGRIQIIELQINRAVGRSVLARIFSQLVKEQKSAYSTTNS